MPLGPLPSVSVVPKTPASSDFAISPRLVDESGMSLIQSGGMFRKPPPLAVILWQGGTMISGNNSGGCYKTRRSLATLALSGRRTSTSRRLPATLGREIIEGSTAWATDTASLIVHSAGTRL